jgi:hypothetical protein
MPKKDVRHSTRNNMNSKNKLRTIDRMEEETVLRAIIFNRTGTNGGLFQFHIKAQSSPP